VFVHDVHFFASADPAQQRDRQLSAEMLAELAQALEDEPASLRIAPLQRWMPKVETQALEQLEDALFQSGFEHADLHRIAAVEREADRDRLTVPQLVRGQRFELVSRPVAVVERPRAACLEWITTLRDLAHM